MRKAIWVLPSLLFASVLAHAGLSVPAGTFTGKGQWKGPGGMTGDYDVETSVKSDLLSSSYRYRQGVESKSESFSYRMTSKDGDPFFDLLDAKGNVVGSGYCYDTECSYRAELSGIVIEETLRFGQGTLEKLGSKKGPGFHVVWKEALQAK